MPDGAKTGPNDFDNIGKFFFYFIFGSIALVYFVVGIEHSFYSAAYLLLMDNGKEEIFELLGCVVI